MARNPMCSASSAEYALTVPTTCKGRSASRAARSRAPAEKRHEVGLELGPARNPPAGVVPAVARAAREPAQHLAADVVDGAGELRGFEHLRAVLDFLPCQHARRTQRLQIRHGLLLAA